MDEVINYVMNTPANTNPNVLKSLLDKMRDSSEEEIQGVAFYDYDGTLVKNVSAEDFANMTAMPENPEHEGLIAQGWNWTLEDAKAYVAQYGALDIGQLYITDDGKTRLYFHVEEDGTQVHVSWPSGTIDWGDGSGETNRLHTYAAGDYVATFAPSTGTSVSFSIIGQRYTGTTDSLKKIEIGNNVLGLECTNCINLETISVPTSASKITRYVTGCFGSCVALKGIVLPPSVESIASSSFNGCVSLKSVSFPAEMTALGESAFKDCVSLKRATLPPATITVGRDAFYYCTSLKDVVLPDAISSMGESVFLGCYNITSIQVPPTLQTVPSYTFESCYSLRRAVLPDSATSIGISTFRNCGALQSSTIPQSVTSIGANNSFGRSLSSLHMLPETPPTLGSGFLSAANSTNRIIYVPVGCLEAYQTASGWSTYASIMREEGT